MNCPNCQCSVAVGTDACLSCGVIFAKFRRKVGQPAPTSVTPEPAPKPGSVMRNLLLAVIALLFGFPLLFIAVRIPEQLRRGMSKQTLGNLGGLRSDISIFYGDEGRFPEDLSELTTGKSHMPPYKVSAPHTRPRKYEYQSRESIPKAYTLEHSGTAAIQNLTGEEYRALGFEDTGGWAYVVSGPSSGSIMVNCTHTDAKGKSWAAY